MNSEQKTFARYILQSSDEAFAHFRAGFNLAITLHQVQRFYITTDLPECAAEAEPFFALIPDVVDRAMLAKAYIFAAESAEECIHAHDITHNQVGENAPTMTEVLVNVRIKKYGGNGT